MVSSAHLAALMNVFKVFLDTDNTLVFSNAAIDFTACLLKHARGTGESLRLMRLARTGMDEVVS